MTDQQDFGIVCRTPQTEAEWSQYYDLRYRILREPLGQPRGAERDAEDSTAIHAMALDGPNGLVACGRIHAAAEGVWQIRYMAVEAVFRRTGVGRRVVEFLEAEVLRRGARRIFMHARDEAVPFYERIGYTVVGDGPTLFGNLRHKRLEKDLGPGLPSDAASPSIDEGLLSTPVLVLTSDLAIASRIAAACRQLGRAARTAMGWDKAEAMAEAAAQPFEVCLVDLDSMRLNIDALARLRSRLSPRGAVVAFGPHVHPERLRAARDAGCEWVVSRGEFFSRFSEIVGTCLPGISDDGTGNLGHSSA